MSIRRFVVVPVEEEVVLQLFNWQARGSVQLPVFEGLPDGYEVQAVVYDYSRQAFMFRVHHPDLPEVPPDVVDPPVVVPVRYRALPLEGDRPSPPTGSHTPWEFLGPPPSH
jgi:hypothetical protein